MKKIGSNKLWRVLASSFIGLLVVSVSGQKVLNVWGGYINKQLGITTTRLVETGDETVDSVYFKSKFSKHTDVMQNARDVAKEVQAQGTVLMTNKNNALPLAKGAKVTFLGYSSVDPAYGGTGSGGVTASEARKTDIVKACANDNKLDLNTTLMDYYKAQLAAKNQSNGTSLSRKAGRGQTAAYGGSFNIPEINPSEFPAEVTSSFDSFKDAGIFVLTRIGGEGSDLIKNSASAGGPKYLALDDKEKAVLQALKDGPFSKRIVLVNTFNTPELDWLDEYNIDACLYIGGTGEVGLDAVTDILVGKTNPSGRLADTYAADSFSSPAMQNFGNFQFSNADDITNNDSKKYLLYQEGIYVGYRYYETRYEDQVLNRFNAKSSKGAFKDTAWDYNKEVVFPFGHGLSYTTFEQKLNRVQIDEGAKKAVVEVKVSNTGSVAGRDVIQIYGQAPYTKGGVEKSAIELVGFHKTELINAGESKTYNVSVDLKDLASYDAKTNKTYIMDKGDYYFAIGNDAHDALNNILAAKGMAASADKEGDTSKVHHWAKGNFNADEYMLSVTNKKITNQFDDVDLNYFDQDKVTYLSRSDWDATWPVTLNDYAAPESMRTKIASYYDAENNPTAYTPGSEDVSGIKVGAEKKYNLVQLKGLERNDPLYDEIIDQLTIEELAQSSRQGRLAIESVNLPATTAVDGPAAWTKSKYKEKYDDYSTEAVKTDESMVLYPTETVIASTWSVELADAVGDSFGEEGLWGGGVGWYGPGANTHRTPYSGRNFEYFSEDGFIAGKLAESECKGAMRHGVIPYLKHFFLNDQETNRIGVCTFANEQSLREIYLNAYEYAFSTTGKDDPACTGVMGAFNRLGVTWTGHSSNLWKNVMQGEWGFTGNVTTDFGQKPQSLMEPQIAYEAGTTMFCTSGANFENILLQRLPKDAKLLQLVKDAVKNNLYNFANSLAMNGLTSTTRIEYVAPWYEIALNSLIIGSSVIVAGSAALLAVNAFLAKKEN